MIFYAGIDDGNFDIKSSDTSTPDGYTVHKKLPPLTKEYLFYDGQYYIPDKNRFDYLEDKTSTDRCLILTLFGIAKQMLFVVGKKNVSSIQDEISNYDELVLGCGLPPLQWNLKDKKLKYYNKHLKKGISFIYNGYDFSFKMIYCKCFPQAAAVMMVNAKHEICKYSRFNAIDIGGGTLEMVPFDENGPDVPNCINEEVGVNFMHQHIVTSAKRDFNIKISPVDVESILRGEFTVFDKNPEFKTYINEQATKWANEQIINRLIQGGCNFDSVPSIFFGGGSLLLKKAIKKNPLVKNCHFLPNGVNANAKAYEILVKKYYLKSLE